MKRISSLTLAILCAYSTINSRAAELRLLGPKHEPLDQVSVSWDSQSGTYYRLWHTDDLADPDSWQVFWTTFSTGGRITKFFHPSEARDFFILEQSTNLLEMYEQLYVNPYSAAQAQVDAWTNSRPQDAATLRMISTNQSFRYLTGAEPDVYSIITNDIHQAKQQGENVLLGYHVTAEVPQTTNSTSYINYLMQIRDGLGNHPAVLVLGANVLPGLMELAPQVQTNKLNALKIGAAVLRTAPAAQVYLDLGHPHWKGTNEMAQVALRADIYSVHGFAVNTANFVATSELLTYIAGISSQLNGIHAIMDVGRNGNGSAPNDAFCNPPGRALGERPTTDVTHPLVDGAFWIKPPGESDGDCGRGEPSAGTFWAEYALGLAQRANW